MSSKEAFKFLANQLSVTPDLSKQLYDEDFDLEYSEDDVVQEPEDDWISSVLGDIEDYVTPE